MMEAVVKCPETLSSLLYDTACLQVYNDFNHPITLYSASSECIQCDLSPLTTVPAAASVPLVVSTKHSTDLSAISTYDNTTLCQSSILFTQHELVAWRVQDNNCTFRTLQTGDDAFLPLYVFVTAVASALLLCLACQALCSLNCSRRLRSLLSRNPVIFDMENDLGNPSSSSDSLPLVQSELVPLRRMNSPRILALDTFRGITISLMIFVNYGGGKYWFFEHSAWNGITVADLVFPWFAWVMGVSLVLSYRSKLRSCASRCAVFTVARRRAATLVVLGLLVNMYNANDLSTARLCGVLQRLGVAHLVVSMLEICFMKKQPGFQRRRWMPVSELVDSWRQWLVILALVWLQVGVSLYLPVPGCPAGYLGPGGAFNHSATPNCTGGAARYVDSLVFGDNHLYLHSPARKVFHMVVPFDPEGLLGTLTTCLTVYLGVQAGYILLSYNSTKQRCLRWLFWALLTGLTAGVLCGWSQEGGLIPVNKQLWSLSFALLTSSAAFLMLTLLFLVIDHCHWWTGGIFRLAGMNAILLYLGHIVTKNTFPWSWKPLYSLTTHSELFLMNVVGVFVWLLIARLLHHNEIYLTI